MSGSFERFLRNDRDHGCNTLILSFVREAASGDLDELRRAVSVRLRRQSCSGLIVDCSALEVVDAELAKGLAQLLRVARFLGAKPIVAGISPGVSAVLVDQDFSLLDFAVSRRTVGEALQLLGSGVGGSGGAASC